MDDIKREIIQLSNQEADDHLKRLLGVVGPMVPIWDEARKENFRSGLVSHNMIWKLFRPGDLVLREDEIGNLWLFVLIHATYSSEAFRNRHTGLEEETKQVVFKTWSLTWNEDDGCLMRKATIFKCADFFGQQLIKSLPVYPIRYQEDIKRENTEQFLAKRGRKWWKLIAEPAICQQHSGLAFSKEGRRMTEAGVKSRVDGRVVIDNKRKTPADLDSILGLGEKGRIVVRESERELFVSDLREPYQWDNLPISTVLTDEQAMLCPPVIDCHDLRNKKRLTVSIVNLQPVKWNEDALSHLVFDEKKKRMLEGLVRHHTNRSRRNEKGDLIAGKGQSLVVLLHGPPGVGKTLTAESIAEAVRKPLVAMSIGEMVWDETQLQERLQTEFQRAIDWDAVLLLDEADVVLEARSFEDVRRNGIVSIFLRELEYYQGILFLTTNRVNTMDTAFQSRIQIGISFKSMTSEIRARVWTELLTLNGRDKIIGPEALQSVQTRLSKYELNGRQIRNALNVAEGLAFQEYGEEGKLKYRHIEEATRAADEFQKMLEESKSMTKLEQTVWAPYKGGDDDSMF
ncbi:hypothetical protein ACHAPE_004926 [Trichoderma viride]